MNTTLPTHSEYIIPELPRTSSVVMGQSNYLSVLLRLVAMELYKLRRSTLTKVLAIIGIATIILTFSILAAYVGTQVNQPTTNFTSPLCSQVPKASNPNCLDHQPTQAELAQNKQNFIKNLANGLILPSSLGIITFITVKLGVLPLLIIILAGSLVGGEYNFGTIRLLFTRGPSRIQFLLAKVLAIAICTISGLLAMTLIGMLLGYLLHPIFGIAPDFSFFTATWLGHSLLMLLIGMLGWFTYALVALFFGTLGRSTVAGIVSGVTWIFMELILGNLLNLIAGIVGGSLGNFLAAIPTYFISNNVSSLIQNQSYSSDQHSLLVLAGYLIVCIGLSCWLTIQRDVTN